MRAHNIARPNKKGKEQNKSRKSPAARIGHRRAVAVGGHLQKNKDQSNQ
jgi:hypothetical protein